MKSWPGALTPDEGVQVEGEWFARAIRWQYLFLGAPDRLLVLGGRGSGKTRLGAEWVNGHVRGFAPFSLTRYGQIALVAETLGDAREVMIEGPSGIATIARGERPKYEATRRRLVWPSGAVAQVFSAEDPDSLRGPQFEAVWADEVAKWRYAEETYDMLQFALRLGERPRQIITTTPKPVPIIRRLLDDPAVTVRRLRTHDNAGNLAPGFIGELEHRYGGTRLGRQEIDGELIEDRPDALWNRAALEALPGGAPQELKRIVVAVDPSATGKARSAACGIVVAGKTEDGNAVVLADGTVAAASPSEWAAKAVSLYHRYKADCIVAEVNQGGDMVATVVRMVDPDVPVKPVRATRGKWVRAEPVAALYEQGRVRHAARLPELEDEMCDFGPDGLSGGRSPDRVDALVWAITDLLIAGRGRPRVRDFA
ncbi:MAG: DNA-packaging protein [Rhizobiaceae bacterium]|nr:DNA-packaging protein [Rhizobiaceae bacterium]